MNNLLIFCKSYAPDMLRARRLVESVNRFNHEDIPMVISVPTKDLNDFKKCFTGLTCDFVTDEEILEKSNEANGTLPTLFPPHLMQQLIKLEFWRLGLCRNYVWIDSDSYFIKDFHIKDLLYDQTTPYVFQEEYQPEQELRNMFYVPRKIRRKRIRENRELIEKFKSFFDNNGPLLRFAGAMPIIWSVTVLEKFNQNFLKKIGKNIYEFLYDYPCETQLYGEYLHASRVIDLHPRPFMFKSFLYADEFHISQMRGENEYSIAKDYFGICMQSNWAQIKKKKKTTKRLKRHFHEFMRTLGFISFK